METRANYAIIGIFTLAAIAAAFGFVFWFSGTESGARKTAFRVEFTGSVAGLTKGAPVLFNGIRVGDVTDVYFDKERPQQSFARIEVQPDTPVREDTKAALDVALLSGAAVIALNGGSLERPALVKREGEDLPTIVAAPGGLGSLLDAARNTAVEANTLMRNLNSVVDQNRDAINGTVANVQVFSKALADNAPGLDNLLASVGSAANRIGPVAQKLEVLTDETTALIRSVEPARVGRIVRNVEDMTQTIADGRAKIANFLNDAAALANKLADTAPKLDQAVTDLSKSLAVIEPAKVASIVDSTQRFTSGIAASTKDVQDTARNANQLTAKLSQSADRIDGVLKAAENFLGSAAGKEGQSTFESIRLAADAFRRASDNLDRRATEIAQGVNKIAGAGTRQLEALGPEARRAVNAVGRAAGNLERNPSSIIFGGGRAAIPEYGGR